MIDQLVISGIWLWIVLGFFMLEGLCQLFRVLNPNSYTKSIVAGKAKLHDNFTRFCGVLGVVFTLYVVFYILGYIS